MDVIDVADRVAEPSREVVDDAVVVVNRFRVPPSEDEQFRALWAETSAYFRRQPGFLSLRLHRPVSAEVPDRWVNVATWASEADYRAAHSTEEFRRLVTQEGWRSFPDAPALFEVVVRAG